MKMLKRNFTAKWALVLCLIFAAMNLYTPQLPAQTFYGSIVGTVTDATGGVIAGASVTLTNLGTSEKRTAQSDSNGAYRFVNLVPGKYRLEVEMTGFKRLVRDAIDVAVESAVRSDAQLEVGTVTDTVEVTAQTPLLQTESSSLSQTVEGRQAAEMPLNGRNAMNLIALVPGVVPQGSSAGAAVGNQQAADTGTHTHVQGWGNYQIGGGMAGQSAMYLDGSPLNTGGAGNSVGLVPVQEMVQEFRVATSNVSSEFGRFSGGVVNMVSKSGSNEWHGSAFEYFRNKVLNSNYFFMNRSGKERGAWVQNQFGGSIGGPIIKDRTYFFFNAEEYQLRVGTPYLATVPTTAMKNGNFSSSLTGGTLTDVCGQSYQLGQIFDPYHTVTVGGHTCRVPFVNNQIPKNQFDYTANVMANVMKYWPDPILAGTTNNYPSQAASGGDQEQYNGRIDQNVSDKQRIFGRFTYWTLADIPFNPLGNFTGNSPSHDSTHSFVFGDTYTFTPTTFLDVRLSYMRQYYDSMPHTAGIDLSQYGAPYASLATQTTMTMMPTPSVPGYYGFGKTTGYEQVYWNNYVGSASLTKIMGRHNFKIGGEWRLMDRNRVGANGGGGGFTISDTKLTALRDNTTLTTSGYGDVFASFLLGAASSGTIGAGTMVGQYSWYEGLYFYDTFQINRKLTFNYGVRWEIPGATSERYNRNAVLLPDAVDTAVTTAMQAKTGVAVSYKGVQALVNSDQYSDRSVPGNQFNLFAPRVGLAYRISDQTVIRAGYGISYLSNNFNGGWPQSAAIASASTAMNATLDNGVTVYNPMSNPFPASGSYQNGNASTAQFIYQVPAASARQAYLDSLKGSTVSAMVPDQAFPYVQQWNLVVEHQFAGNLMIGAGYAGSKGTHLPSSGFNINQISDAAIAANGAALGTNVTNPFLNVLPAANALGKGTVQYGQLLRPYPNWGNLTSAGAQFGDTVYHSFQLKVEKRFGAGGVLMGNYTWAKILGDVDTTSSFLEGGTVGSIQDYTNLRAERSLISSDVPHRLVASYVLDLPFGKGKKFASGATGAASKLISGWGINGIFTLQSGFPLSLQATGSNLGSYGVGTIRPMVVNGCASQYGGKAQDRLGTVVGSTVIGGWFNTACFVNPTTTYGATLGPYKLGNESRVDPVLRAAGVNNWDFSVFKNTQITERFGLQFRAEAFNVFNRVQFAPPGTSLASATAFGVVSAQSNQPRLIQFALRLSW